MGEPNPITCLSLWRCIAGFRQGTEDEVIAWKKNTGGVFSRQERSKIISIIEGWQSAIRS